MFPTQLTESSCFFDHRAVFFQVLLKLTKLVWAAVHLKSIMHAASKQFSCDSLPDLNLRAM